MLEEEFLAQLDRSASEGQASQKEHLLSEDLGKGNRMEADTEDSNDASQRYCEVRMESACLGCCNSLVSVNIIYNRKDGNRPGTEVQALGFPLLAATPNTRIIQITPITRRDTAAVL